MFLDLSKQLEAPVSEDGAAGNAPSEDARFESLIANLQLAEINGLNGPEEAHNSDLALLQLTACERLLWGKVFDRFLPRYLDAFPPEKGPIDKDYFEDILESVVFEDSVVRLTQFILRRSLENKKLSLTDLAKQVYKGDSQHLNRFRRNLRDNVVRPMHRLAIWHVKTNHGITKDGKERIASYEITAGKALQMFYRKLYCPLRKRQLQMFFEKYGQEWL